MSPQFSMFSLVILGREFLVDGGGVVLFGKSAVKNAYSIWSLRKILVPPSESLSKIGTSPGAGSFSRQQGQIARKGHPE